MPVDLEEFRRNLRETLKKNREAFEGAYKEQIDGLLGLSRTEIDEITPDTTDLAVYDELIAVVKEASRTNLAQAELKSQIEEMGDVAVSIAKRVTPLVRVLGVPV